jgi:putative nucleotidyltransferase with HDIG domain
MNELTKENLYDLKFLKKYVKEIMLESNLTDRYKHTIAVSLVMKDKASELGLDPHIAQCIGLLHDIGYTNRIKTTGFHALDGYNHLLTIDKTTAERIALHTSTPEEAELRNIPIPKIKQDIYAILLSYADARVMGNGKIVSFEERLEDIINRYGENHIVSIANKKAWIRLKEEEKLLLSFDNKI